MRELGADLDDLDIYVQRVSAHTRIPYEHVEKDFWLTEAIKACTRVADDTGVTLVFKGGTSLSKVYHLIERFSEDVDMLVVFPNEMSGSARHKIFTQMAGAAGEATRCTPWVDSGKSERGVKRPAMLPFPKASDTGQSALRRGGILLELGARGGAHPHNQHEVRSLVAEHAAAVDLPVDFSEAPPAKIDVQDPSRTLVEKLSLLHTAAVTGSSTRKLRTSRHYYDVYQLLESADVRAATRRLGVRALADDVVGQSRLAGLPAVDFPAGGFGSSPAFTDPGPPEARRGYEDGQVQPLLWPGAAFPTFDACCARVRDYAELLK